MINKIISAMIFLLVMSAVTTLAQSPEKSVLEARDRFSDIKKRSIELERMKREAGKRPANKDVTREFPNIKEDFEQIQILNNNILKLTSAETPINYAVVLKSVSEINHRAVRLNSNLFSTEPDKKKNPKRKNQTVKRQKIKKLLDNLEKSINSFSNNSIFQNLNLVNSEDSLKAQKDLENIIEISYKIRKLEKDYLQK